MDRKERDKKYSREWRKKNKDKIKAYLKRTKKHRQEVAKGYYKKNCKRIRKQSMNAIKRSGYAYDSQPERKLDCQIRKKTRIKYPLDNQKCCECNKPAEHRHHTTKPIEVDKFMFLCEYHHNKIHGRQYALTRKHDE